MTRFPDRHAALLVQLEPRRGFPLCERSHAGCEPSPCVSARSSGGARWTHVSPTLRRGTSRRHSYVACASRGLRLPSGSSSGRIGHGSTRGRGEQKDSQIGGRSDVDELPVWLVFLWQLMLPERSS